MLSFKRQNGTAIFMALLVVTIVTAIAVMWFAQQKISIWRTQQMLISEQAYLYAQGTVDWGIGILKAKAKKEPEKTDDEWPKTLPETVIADNQGVISGSMEDYQSRFNVNNLKTEEAKKIFAKLLASLVNGMDENQAQQLANAIHAWTIPPAVQMLTSTTSTFSGESQQLTPYRAAYAPMLSISELRMVSGITPMIYALLQPYVSALPPGININLKHALPPIAEVFKDATQKSSLTTETSEYFLVRADVHLSNQYLILYTLLHRKVSGGSTEVSIVWQSRGTL